MIEEIKEILDYIDDRIIPNEKWDKIKDYITNLQQLYENALIKFNYLSVSDNEIKDFVDNELKNMKGND